MIRFWKHLQPVPQNKVTRISLANSGGERVVYRVHVTRGTAWSPLCEFNSAARRTDTALLFSLSKYIQHSLHSLR